jgi:serine/threonine protein kinase
MSEIVLIRTVQSSGVIKLYNVYESEQYIHLVYESINDELLLSVIKRRRNYSEADTRKVMKSLLHIIDHMHSKLIVHRDLKPDNIVAA